MTTSTDEIIESLKRDHWAIGADNNSKVHLIRQGYKIRVTDHGVVLIGDGTYLPSIRTSRTLGEMWRIAAAVKEKIEQISTEAAKSPAPSTKMSRAWINQPSTHQLYHMLHGKRVLADLSHPFETSVTIYFLEGDTISQLIHRSALSKGWPQP